MSILTKPRLVVFLLPMLCGAVSEGLHAQLSKQLSSESLTQLASDARANGDAIRGAILFPQETLGCTKCHSEVGDDLLGPNLTQISRGKPDEYLVESLLFPSKSIAKGYETTTVLTLDDRIVNGRLLSSTEAELIVRENSDERKRVTVARNEIDRIVTSSKSLMPDGLVDQLKNRQQFLDLVRYLIELRDSADSKPASKKMERSDLDANLRGLVSIDRFLCVNCHANNLTNSLVPVKSAPRLTELVGMLDPSYVEKFIADPTHVKPGTAMPDMLVALTPSERSSVARQITHYLVSRAKRKFEVAAIDGNSVKRGKELYHSVGCVACHSPRDAGGQPILMETSVSLGEMRYSLDGMTRFLEDPHAVRPSGRMPNMKLNHWEATDLANYLLSLSPQDTETATPNSFRLDPVLAQKGERQFHQHRCTSCHDESTSRPNTLVHPTAPGLADVQLSRGCLSSTTGEWPQFSLAETEVDLIRDAISHFRFDRPLSDTQQIQLSMEIFRCTSCHQRGELGGVADERDDYFETTNPNLGPQGRIPPALTEVGAKLMPKWMREVLVSGRSIRPYVQTRMPQYGTQNVEHLIDLFQNNDRLPAVELPKAEGAEQEKLVRDSGFELVSDSGLNCVACHTFQLKPALTMPAVDLTEMHERLKPDWFYHYMLDPKRFHHGTVMPAFWPAGKASRNDILKGDTDQQIAAIWEWMRDGRQARTPRGLVNEPMTLLATDEAVMLRRSYPGIGKRGIGVGYPEKVNLAFDAEQMRIGLLWQGEFADPSGVWRGQGHGVVRPLAREQVKFGPGPEVDDLSAPWQVDDGRPPNSQFQGYKLDDLRRPIFLYRFEDVAIEDYSVDSSDSGVAMLQRTITLKSKSLRGGLAFRLAPQDPITLLSPGVFQIGGMMVVRVRSADSATIVEGENGQLIQIRVDLEPSQPKQLILEYEWK